MTPQPEIEDVYRQIGVRIAHARRQAKMTQQEMADEIGLTRTSVVNIEKGRQKILVHTLLAIGRRLNITAVKLLEGISDVQDSKIETNLKNFSADIQAFILSGARLATRRTLRTQQ